MSQEKADALVDDLIAQHQAANQFNLNYLESFRKDRKEQRRDSQVRFFALLLFVLLLVLLCAYFDNWQFLFELIPIVGAALAGGGGVLIWVYQRKGDILKRISRLEDD